MLNLNSQRGLFAHSLMSEMEDNEDIYLLTADLGYGVLTPVMDAYPKRIINTGAAEQCMMDIAIGMTLAGKRVFAYSITPFLLYRPFEAVNLYIHGEDIPIQLVGSGMNNDYAHDGLSHSAKGIEKMLELMPNIRARYPKKLEEIPLMISDMCKSNSPGFIGLSR